MKFILALLLLAFSAISNAVTLTISWDHPTTRTDATALQQNEIKRYNVSMIVDAAVVAQYRISGMRNSIVLSHVELYATDDVTIRVVCVDTGNRESAPATATVDITNVAGGPITMPPGKPLLLIIEIAA